MASLTVEPTTAWPWLLLLALGAGVLIWWPPGASEGAQPLSGRLRRTGAVALLLIAALRPGVPGGSVAAATTELDVFFVVDTTSSMVAEDYDGTRPRLDGVKADVAAAVAGLPGARFSLLTFDRETVTRLPLTADAQALTTAMEVLQVETSSYSQGSSITAAGPELDATLQRDQQAHPDRGRLVFYLGDGEQTASSAPTPFAVDDALVDGGAVLGYGTSAGGRMRQTGTRTDGYIVDPSSGDPAVSVVDEKALQDVAQQLSLPYLHRTSARDAPVLDAAGVREARAASSATGSTTAGGRTELYWVALLLLAAVVAWEIAATLAAVRLRDSASATAPGGRHRPSIPMAGPGPQAPGEAAAVRPMFVPGGGPATTNPTSPTSPTSQTTTGGPR